MATFEAAIDWVINHEGGELTKDPVWTRWGVTLPEIKTAGLDYNQDGVVDLADIDGLTREEAREFYRQMDWREEFAYIADQRVATKVLDLCVNVGEKQAIKLLQRACRAVTGYALTDDGVFGSRTLAATNGSDPGRLLAAMASEAAGFYRLISAARADYKQYLNGWLNRAYDTPRERG